MRPQEPRTTQVNGVALHAAKASLRRAALDRREAVPPALRATLGALAISRLLRLPEYRRAGTVLAFASFGHEIDTAPLLRDVLASGRRLALPRVELRRRDLTLAQVRDLRHLAPGRWGIPEPPDGCPEVAVSDVDLMVVPGVAFDESGLRIGYGRGYYDRLLSAWRGASRGAPPAACGLALECQLWPAVPAGPGDARLDLLVTEAGVRRFTSAGRAAPGPGAAMTREGGTMG
jgi:5-formyltetrahydrofolate cyclo-ligase